MPNFLSQIPIPIYRDIKDIVVDTHIIPTSDQFIPLHEARLIENSDLLPVVSVNPIRMWEKDERTKFVQIINITIWDWFPALSDCKNRAEAGEIAYDIMWYHVAALKQVVDILLSEDSDSRYYAREYEQESERINYLPRFRRSAFDFGLDYKEDIVLGDSLMGPTAVLAVAGPTKYMCCDLPVYNNTQGSVLKQNVG